VTGVYKEGPSKDAIEEWGKASEAECEIVASKVVVKVAVTVAA
jgi:hypothetical protein